MATLVYGRHLRGRRRPSRRRWVSVTTAVVSRVVRPFRAAAESGVLPLIAVQFSTLLVIFAGVIGASL